MDTLSAYIHLSSAELLYALSFSAVAAGALYGYLRVQGLKSEKALLVRHIESLELDRDSLMASTHEVVDTAGEKSLLNDTSNTLLQQELEAYLLRAQEKEAKVEQDFVALSTDFIDFLKVKSGKITLNEHPFSLNEMLDDLSKSLRSLTMRSGVELLFDIETKIPPRLQGDKGYIRLLLFNILSNIIHNSGDKEVLLSAKSRVVDGRRELLFSVASAELVTGLKDIELMFQPFSERAIDESMQIEFYIARELCRMMQGDIKVVRQEGRRLLFEIALSVEESNPENKRYYHLPSRSMIGRNIMVITGNQRLGRSIKEMYEYFKNEVTLSARLEEDFEPKSLEAYHTVVVEKAFLNLPVVEKIRALKRDHRLNVVVLLSAKDAVGYEAPFGAVDHTLIKPATIQSVFATIIASEENLTAVDQKMVSRQKSEASEAHKKSLQEYATKKVLLIEGEMVNQKIVVSMLRRSGINLTLAQTAQESLWLLEKLPLFDLIMIADEINTKHQVHLSQKIRNLRRYRGVPIIVMSPSGTGSEARDVDQYIAKPVQIGQLVQMFGHYLTKETMLDLSDEKYRPKASYINTVTLSARNGYEMASYDAGLYRDILQEFVTLYGDSSEVMNSILVRDDLEELKQLCLDIKGVSANIGAYRLASITAQAHAAIAKGKVKDLMALVNQYQPELERVKSEIEGYLAKG